MQACAIGLAAALCACSSVLAQNSDAIKLTGYRVLYSQPMGNSGVEIVAQATVTNFGAAVPELSATVESSSGVVIEAGRLNFGGVAPGATSDSINTFVYKAANLAPLNLASCDLSSITNRLRVSMSSGRSRAAPMVHCSRGTFAGLLHQGWRLSAWVYVSMSKTATNQTDWGRP